jgi:hypothetical protein
MAQARTSVMVLLPKVFVSYATAPTARRGKGGGMSQFSLKKII